jgi:hypothetical protein
LQKKQDLAVLQTNGSGVLSFAGVSASAGQVIQVITATDSTTRATNSQTFVTASNTLSVTITPSSASNKIFVIATATLYHATDTGKITIFRGATNLGTASHGLAEVWNGASAGITAPACISILDSPATTSATTYQVYIRSNNTDNVGLGFNSTKHSITCFEIKG